jgi:hypothetical protein
LSPIVASAKIRNGIMIEVRKKELAVSGTTTNATRSTIATPTRSCQSGKTAWSAA